MKEIIIAGIKYEIKFVDGDYCGGNMGKCDYGNAKIFINKDMPVDMQENVLLHEIMHICYRNGYLSKDDAEERVVEVLTNFLYPVLKQEPFKIIGGKDDRGIGFELALKECIETMDLMLGTCLLKNNKGLIFEDARFRLDKWKKLLGRGAKYENGKNKIYDGGTK